MKTRILFVCLGNICRSPTAEGVMRRLVRERCYVLVRIPLLGRIESLNVSVAAGVILYEAVRQRRALRVTSDE